ncbi:hypothetical protein [Peterkaempfera griseoplana]|uniref:hypothetical protein n=1 Tax=Peterkaempfera griseoplana TaxID=66896 RepID=UPI0006E18DE1|nr:hypothetical protein [Peterkaempfera griseoplana]
MAGSGYKVQIEHLQDFAKRVRGLLSDFESGADGDRTHAESGVAASSFGPFAEARELDQRYAVMRDSLRDVLDILHRSLDDAQRNADATARNYAEQEHGTAVAMRADATARDYTEREHGTAAAVRAGATPVAASAPRSRAQAEQSDTW